MKTFFSQSIQLRDTLKWIPSGVISERNYEQITDTELEFPEVSFDTREEADKYFVDYCLSKGYKAAHNPKP